MKNKWLQFLFGYVTVRVVGEGIENFINTLMKSRLVLWDLRRGKGEMFFFKISIGDISEMRKLKRRFPCKVYFHTRSGLPFLWKRLLKNIGFLIGAALFFVVIFLLSNMVWKIEVSGAQPDTEYKIVKKLEEYGVTEGSLQLFSYTPEQLQQKLTDEIEELTWIGVEFKGTAYEFTVVEKTEPTPIVLLDPQHLVAKKKAVIVNLFVEEGQPLVSVNDYVQPGQLLVSAYIGKPENAEIVAAKGVVWGETWYRTDVELDVDVMLDVLNGNAVNKWRMNLFGLDVPVWGIKDTNFKTYVVDEDNFDFNLFGYTFPISIIKQTYRQTEKLGHTYTEEEALKKGLELAKEDLLKKLPEDAYIKGEKVLHKTIENGKVNLSIHFQVIENIAIAQPIIQGDTQ